MSCASDTAAVGQPAAEVPAPEIAPPSQDGAPQQDWRADRIRQWLLALLRYAVTWDAQDQAPVLALANDIDAAGMRRQASTPSFFGRTSVEVCGVIPALDDPTRETVLKKHIARIDE